MQDRLQRLIDGAKAWQQEREGLIAQLAEARRVLRLVEWGKRDGWCRVCHKFEEDGLHAPDCALAAVLMVASPTPPTETHEPTPMAPPDAVLPPLPDDWEPMGQHEHRWKFNGNRVYVSPEGSAHVAEGWYRPADLILVLRHAQQRLRQEADRG